VLALAGCGGDDGEDPAAPATSSSTPAASIASPEAYALAKEDLGRAATDSEARRYDAALERLEREGCTNSRADLGALAETVVDGAAENVNPLKVTRLRVLRKVVIVGDQPHDCTDDFENYLVELLAGIGRGGI